MPRTLPWSKGGTATVTVPSKDERSPKRQKVSHPVSEDEDPGSTATRPRKTRPKQKRTPSTSPPPAPPTPEFMRHGFDKDDIYMMVEDEFLSTAQQFTQHLHHAEYVRLKNLAKSQNASTLRSIARPVDDRTQARPELKKKQQAAELATRQAKGLKEMTDIARSGAEDEEEEDEAHDPWMQHSHLAGLMTSSPRKSQALLSDFAATRANTRAAAGYTRGRNPSPARVKPILGDLPPSPAPTRPDGAVLEDESDLDAPTESKSRAQPESGTFDRPKPRPSLPPSRDHGGPPDLAFGPSSSHRDVSAFFKSTLKPPIASSAAMGQSKRAMAGAVSFAPSQSRLNSGPSLPDVLPGPQPNFNHDAPSTHTLSAEAIARLARRKAERARREREKAAVRVEEIPTFLI